MNLIQQLGNRLNTRYLIIGLVAWWVAMLIVYSIFTIRANQLKGKLRQSGVEITLEFSDLVSLPLLEKNSLSISNLLTDAASRADVIYASVVDHRNKVVAFTGTGHLMPDKTATASAVDKVSIWEGGFSSHARILNFVSDITYAGTKIGEIFIGLSTPEMFQTRKQFIIFAVASCLIFLILVAGLRYQTLRAFMKKYADVNRSQAAKDSAPSDTMIHCPLCGTQQPLSRQSFKRSGLDKFLISAGSKLASNPGAKADAKRPDLHDAGKKEDLSWLRRQIILRCTDIIKKLAA
jgi:hypothetical protein